MKTSTGLILLGGAAIIGYFLLKDKIPSIPGAIGGAIAGAPAAVTIALGASPETIQETGVVGGVGDLIYNITRGGDLRESATQPGGAAYEAAKAEIPRVTGVTPTPEMIVPRAVALQVSEDIHKGGWVEAATLAPVTIGAGLGAITQQARYREALPTEEAKAAALQQEYTTREEYVRGHPVESLIGFPALIAHAVTAPAPQTDFFSTLARGWGRIFG